MTLASSVCPPQSSTARSIEFMESIKPWVDLKFNHQSRSRLKKISRFNRGSMVVGKKPAYANEMDQTPGTLIKAALDRLGMKQGKLAEKMGVSDNAVSKWIKTGGVETARIGKLCTILGIHPSVFIGEWKEAANDAECFGRPAQQAPEQDDELADNAAKAISALLRLARLAPDALGSRDEVVARLKGEQNIPPTHPEAIRDSILFALSHMTLEGIDPRRNPAAFADIVQQRIRELEQATSQPELSTEDRAHH